MSGIQTVVQHSHLPEVFEHISKKTHISKQVNIVVVTQGFAVEAVPNIQSPSIEFIRASLISQVIVKGFFGRELSLINFSISLM